MKPEGRIWFTHVGRHVRIPGISGPRTDPGLIRRDPCLVPPATFAGLRWAELAALRPQDIDLDARTVRVTRQISYQRGGGHSFGPLKSRAGLRVVSFPDLIVPELRRHLAALGQSGTYVARNGGVSRESLRARQDSNPRPAA